MNEARSVRETVLLRKAFKLLIGARRRSRCKLNFGEVNKYLAPYHIRIAAKTA